MLEVGSWLVGSRVTYRRLVDWVQLGLVPAPVKHGLGRGRGCTSGWTDFAFRLWVDQLLTRSRLGLDMAGLANSPVASWVFMDPSPVEYPQVRRALNTWASRWLERRTGKLHKNTRSLVARLADEHATRRDITKLSRLLARLDEPTGQPHLALPPVIRSVIAPGEVGRTGSPLREPARRAALELVAEYMGSELLAADPKHDSAWLGQRLTEARAYTRRTTLGRAADVARGGGKPDVGELVGLERKGVACRDLSEAVGMLRLRELGVLNARA